MQNLSAEMSMSHQKVDAPKEKEYDNAVILLVDTQAGLLGVEVEDEKTHTKQRLSFSVKVSDVFVTSPMNKSVEWPDVKIGDRVDLTVSTDKDGKETVTDILDYNAFQKD